MTGQKPTTVLVSVVRFMVKVRVRVRVRVRVWWWLSCRDSCQRMTTVREFVFDSLKPLAY